MYIDTVDCPYCRYDNDMDDASTLMGGDNIFDVECEQCEQWFKVEVEFNPIYTSKMIEYTTCDNCKLMSRDITTKGRTEPWPEEGNFEVLCRDCFMKINFGERE